MLKMLLILAVLAGVAYFGSQALEGREGNGPATPSVGYPTIGDGGAGQVGDATNGVLGN